MRTNVILESCIQFWVDDVKIIDEEQVLYPDTGVSIPGAASYIAEYPMSAILQNKGYYYIY